MPIYKAISGAPRSQEHGIPLLIESSVIILLAFSPVAEHIEDNINNPSDKNFRLHNFSSAKMKR